MINDSTNVYEIIKREFPETVKNFGILDDKELASFLHYNAHNQILVDTNEYYYHNVNFKNLDTGIESRMFTEGDIYFFPTNDDIVSTDHDMIAFRIGKETKSIRVNENGLFVEKNDLKGNILTQYYDMAAVSKISDAGIGPGSIDYVEEYIEHLGIQPDRIISVNKKDGDLILTIAENDEIVRNEQIKADENRTSYSTYFEFMKANNYYSDSYLQTHSNGMHR